MIRNPFTRERGEIGAFNFHFKIDVSPLAEQTPEAKKKKRKKKRRNKHKQNIMPFQIPPENEIIDVDISEVFSELETDSSVSSDIMHKDFHGIVDDECPSDDHEHEEDDRQSDVYNTNTVMTNNIGIYNAVSPHQQQPIADLLLDTSTDVVTIDVLVQKFNDIVSLVSHYKKENEILKGQVSVYTSFCEKNIIKLACEIVARGQRVVTKPDSLSDAQFQRQLDSLRFLRERYSTSLPSLWNDVDSYLVDISTMDKVRKARHKLYAIFPDHGMSMTVEFAKMVFNMYLDGILPQVEVSSDP